MALILFELIKNLRKSEKRFITILLSQYKEGDTSILPLLEFYFNMENYNKQEEAHFFKENNVKYPNQLKAYLHRRILKYLRVLWEDKLAEGPFFQRYENALIYREKGMKKAFWKEYGNLNKVVPDDTMSQLIYLKMSRGLYQEAQSFPQKKLLSNSFEERLDLLKQLEEETHYEQLLFEVNQFKQHPKENKQAITQLRKHPLLKKVPSQVSFYSLKYYWLIQSQMNSWNNNREELLACRYKLLALYNEHPFYIKKEYEEYVEAHFQLLKALLLNEDWKQFKVVKKAFQQLGKGHDLLEASMLQLLEHKSQLIHLLHLFSLKKYQACTAYFESDLMEASFMFETRIGITHFEDAWLPALDAALYSSSYGKLIDFCKRFFILSFYKKNKKMEATVHFFHLLGLALNGDASLNLELRKKKRFFENINKWNASVARFFSLIKGISQREITKEELNETLKDYQDTSSSIKTSSFNLV